MSVADPGPVGPPSNAPRRRSGIVVPRKLTWRHHVTAWFIALVVRAVSSTWRCAYVDTAHVFEESPPRVIFAVWHNRLAVATIAWRHWSKKKSPGAGLVALISASHDGGVLSYVLNSFGIRAVRGSSSRRGAQALLELTSWAERNYNIAITPDGPRGPRYVVHDGTIALAQLTGLPIIPVSTDIRGKLVTRSWDQFQIPLPFARCAVRFGEPIYVPRDCTDDQREQFKRELEKRLLNVSAE